MTEAVEIARGSRFGRLVVVGRVESTASGKARWLCECDCGERLGVTGDKLRRGQKSCGCGGREREHAVAV